MSDTQIEILEDVEKDGRIAYRQLEAAQMIGVSLRTLSREIKRGKLFPTDGLRLITREELLRYLRDETQVARRRRRHRVPRSQYKPVPQLS